jgi:predicted tellurium resistance membrane protein TerC
LAQKPKAPNQLKEIMNHYETERLTLARRISNFVARHTELVLIACMVLLWVAMMLLGSSQREWTVRITPAVVCEPVAVPATPIAVQVKGAVKAKQAKKA